MAILLRTLVATLLLIFHAGVALAHATLLRSDPADGALLREPPSRIEMTFDEPVAPLVLLLVDPGGDTRALTEVTAKDAALSIGIPRDIGEGTHILSWRVISADGHPVGGSLVMSIGRVSAGTQAPGQRQSNFGLAAFALWLCRLGMLAGLLIGVGGVVYLRTVAGDWQPPDRLSSGLQMVLLGGGAATVVSIGLQGVDAHGRGLADLADWTMWRTGLATSHGTQAMLAMVAVLAAAMARYRAQDTPRNMRTVGTCCAILALASSGLALAASGHASTAPPQSLSRILMLLHAIALVWWLGSLSPLTVQLRADGSDLRDNLRRFSTMVLPVMTTLLLTGVALAVIQVERPSALWSTEYGLLLMTKLIFVAGVLGLAAYNRWRLVPRIAAGDAQARVTMQGVITAEILLACLIVAIAAAWRFTPPPRVLLAQPVPLFQIHMHGTTAMANVVLSPARAGPVRAVIHPRTPDLRPLAVKEIEISIIGEQGRVEPIRRKARLSSDDSWVVDDLVIPAPGRWRVLVEMLVTDFEKARIEARILVQ